MNTLLLLTLRKARALENFKWDIRVELSREVFKALHRIQSLQHLHLRMQAGESIHQIAPPLPSSTTATSAPPSPYLPTPPPLSHHNAIVFIPPLPISYTPIFATAPKPAAGKGFAKNNKNAPNSSPASATLSNFHDLRSLSILDMDSHEYLEEIKTCLENSSSTLTTLKLSFSDALATKARKPPPEIHSDDESDIEDEFGQLVPPPGVVDPNAPTKALKAQEEKKRQEVALEQIFGGEPSVSKLSIITDSLLPKEKEEKKEVDVTSKHVKTFVDFYSKFMAQVRPGQQETPEVKKAVELVEKATRLYFDAAQAAGDGTPKTPELGVDHLSPSTGPAIEDPTIQDEVVMSGGVASEDAPGLFDQPKVRHIASTTDPGVSKPEDIDIEAPEIDVLALDAESTIDGAQSTSSTTIAESGQVSSAPDTSEESSRFLPQQQGKNCVSAIDNFGELNSGNSDGVKPLADTDVAGDRRSRSTYIRKTRGLTLRELSIYQIPIKTSVLSKAIDLSVLQNISLLSVGPQNSLWSHLEKENKQSPLLLRRIHTDNVTMPFLNLVSQLEKLEELYMLERLPKRGFESSTPKTLVTTEHIRKAVLKKHVGKLKVLAIRNDATTEWDLNTKSVMLLCQKAEKLEELTAGFSNKAMVS